MHYPRFSLLSLKYWAKKRRDAIELQYIGNNIFTVLSHEGYLVVL